MEILIRLKGYMRYIKAVKEGTDLEVMLNFTTVHVIIVPKRRREQCLFHLGLTYDQPYGHFSSLEHFVPFCLIQR